MLKSFLVTGGAGFIGSNFIPYFLTKYSDYRIINLDSLTYAGNPGNLSEVEDHKNYTFIKGDICDRSLLESIFTKEKIEGVIHFAAESHVDNSIVGPGEFIRTNVTGTFTLIDVARLAWKGSQYRFHHISTDEVYGSLGDTGLFSEKSPYAPNSPYSASKASSDLIVRSYHHTYGMNVVTTNCSNNYGPKQHSEKLIPTIIRKAVAGEKIPVYGDGKNVRDWLYVTDHCEGIDLAFHFGRSGETYNIGGRNERVNIDIVKLICSLLDERMPKPDRSSYQNQISFVTDRPGHDRRYAIDATKIEQELGWKALETFDSGIVKTVDWYLKQAGSR